MRTMTALLLMGALLMTGCTPGSGGGDEDDQDERLQAARTRVLDDLTPALGDLTAGLPATLRFSSGKYASCKNNLSGATAVTYAVNGRLDLAAGPAGLDAVRSALDGAGFEVADDNGTTVTATKGDTRSERLDPRG